MPMSWGRALSALGGGLSGWADDLTQQRAQRQATDTQLASRGYFKRDPKPAMQPGTGMMESLSPATDPMLDAVGSAGEGRALIPGMRPQPPSATMGMDVDLDGDVGWEDPRAYSPPQPAPPQGRRADYYSGLVRTSAPAAAVEPPAAAQPSPATPERLDALKAAVQRAAPKDYSEIVEYGGQAYDYRPERTPEGRRAALQEAVRERQNREAFRVLAAEDEGVGAYNPQINYGDVGERRLGDRLRTRVDPEANRRYFDELNRMSGGRLQYIDSFDYRKGYEGAVGRENAQTNQREIRIEFPRQSGGGRDGNRDENGLSAPSRDERTQNANAEIEVIMRRNAAAGKPVLLTQEEMRDVLRRHTGASMPQVAARAAAFAESLKGGGSSRSGTYFPGRTR